MGPLQDQRLQRRLLALAEPWRPPAPGPIPELLSPFRVVAMTPVPERLAGHPGKPRRLLVRRLLAGDALQRVRQRQQAGADTAVALMAGQPAQLGRAAVGADRQGSRHGGSSRSGHCTTA